GPVAGVQKVLAAVSRAAAARPRLREGDRAHAEASAQRRRGEGARCLPRVPALTADGRAAPGRSIDARELELVSTMTGDEVARRDRLPRRRLTPADVDGMGAARVEIAAAGRRGWIGHLCLKHEPPRAR